MPSYIHYTHSRTRERSPSPSRSFYHTYSLEPEPSYTTQLIRRSTKSKPKYFTAQESEEVDDYPWPGTRKPTKPPRAVTITSPKKSNQIEDYNIWSYPAPLGREDSWERKRKYTSITPSPSRKDSWDKKYKYTYDYNYQPPSSRYHYARPESPVRGTKSDSNGWDFEARLRYTRPSKSKSESKEEQMGKEKPYHWPAELFRREKTKWEREDWQHIDKEKKRDRKVMWSDEWNDYDEANGWDEKEWNTERTTRYRSVRRGSMEEWRPLSGFRGW
ncbi:hypothetical protein GQ43DRAFT_443788 [Delitschia confertaspora ATCC 74209]|uniref:Uncharacterized protein n=1 Tax=Delitschia confertaspora ATCC 74209 TaxID=1513339 RepID=A0A9P4MPH7_9PLEO|nr:hypothetical protein GQ43DRAFT_443788 [Delitschia confertaspora ATCC 74209]